MSGELTLLRQFVVNHFSLEEVRTLCFDLGINYDNLGGEGINAKVRELLLQIGHRKQFDQLLNVLRQTRPSVLDSLEIDSTATFLERLYTQLPSIRTSGQRPREEQFLLDKVKSFWVEGVLEKSLHGIALIELGKDVQSDAVDYPWEMVVKSPYLDPNPTQLKRPISDVFDNFGGALLILGEPGSGKTTMLLDLARAKIAEAEHNSDLPVPVVFNLSSWLGNKTIAEWLIDELGEKYLIPRRIGTGWVERDRLLILLDGLDEVKREHQSKCVEAINHFRQEHGLGQIAVCSRNEEYQRIIQEIQKLKFECAVLIQPLTPQQIEEYLQSGGPKLETIRAILKAETFLKQIVQSPLMLSIVTLAYRGISSEKLQPLNTIENHRNFLFATFVQQMLSRRQRDKKYSSERTIRWLGWLAQQMAKESSTVFLIERIQPYWLSSQKQRLFYTIAVMLIAGLPISTLIGIGAGYPVHLYSEELGRFLSLGTGLAAIFAIWLALNRIFGVTGSLIIGFVAGLAFGLTVHQAYGLFAGTLIGVGVGGITGLTFGFIGNLFKEKSSLYYSNIEIFETLRWSSIKSIRGMLIGAIAGTIFGLSIWLAVGQFYGLRFGLIFASAFGLASSLVASLLSGLTGAESEVRTIPNQGIWQSGKNASRIGLVVALIVGPLVGSVSGWAWGLAYGLNNGLRVGFSTGLTIGLAFGLGTALFFGGLSFIQHFVLRFILYKNDYIPWNYSLFLDFAADHLFLRKVGSGYIFVHRTLLEFFADLGTGSHTTHVPDL